MATSIKEGEKVEQDNSIDDCAVEQIDRWMASWDVPVAERDWLLRWANLRAKNVIRFLSEPMSEIANMKKTNDSYEVYVQRDDMRRIANRALKTCALEKEV